MVIPIAELIAAPIPPAYRLEPRGPTFEEVLLRSVRQVGDELEKREVSLDALIRDATSGRRFSNQELLVLQVQMHQYSMAVELLSKIVQQTVQGLREVLRTQV